MTWNKTWEWGWVAILLFLAFYEFWSGFGPTKHTPMLTQVTCKWVPWWITMSFLTWLFLHFALRYSNPAYLHALGTTSVLPHEPF